MRKILREILLIIGFASVVAGIAFIYAPAAFIIGGVALMWLCAPTDNVKDKREKN